MAVRNNAVRYRAAADILLFALIVVAAVAEAPSADPNATSEEDRWVHASRALPFHLFVKSTLHVNSKFLVVDQAPDVKYHNGPILTGDRRSTLKVHVVFYGSWSRAQKAIIQSFLSSFSAPKAARNFPTVQGWWAITRGFKNTRKVSVAPYVVLGSQVHDWKYSLGKRLKQTYIEKLVVSSLKNGLALDASGLYIVLTSQDVSVQGFCSSLCGTHSVIPAQTLSKMNKLPYVWVGNSAKFCGGYCAWPFFKPLPGTGFDVPPLKSPNGDAGVDGMIINIGAMIAGAATNPYGRGYFQGDPADPLEVAGVCAGIYGANSFPGMPGDLLKDSRGASFNVYGANRRKFLVPWMYSPRTKQCAGQA